MPSVVGLLEEHELAARRRVDGLREEADRIQAELAAAEQEWQEWVIARRRVGTVLAPDGGGIADEKAAPGPRDADVRSAPGQAAKAKSQVPVWREGLGWSVLSVDYQRILEALADRHRLHQAATCVQRRLAAKGRRSQTDRRPRIDQPHEHPDQQCRHVPHDDRHRHRQPLHHHQQYAGVQGLLALRPAQALEFRANLRQRERCKNSRFGYRVKSLGQGSSSSL